jgi:hypothetical protein
MLVQVDEFPGYGNCLASLQMVDAKPLPLCCCYRCGFSCVRRTTPKDMTTTSVTLKPGVLVTSDEPTIVFLTVLDKSLKKKFITREIDACSILVSAESVPYVQRKLAERLEETTFEEDEELNQPMKAHP